MTTCFTLADLISISEAFVLFALFAFAPGYVLGWLLDILQFRGRSLLARAALSIPLSIAFCPLLSYLLGRWLPPPMVLGAFAVSWIAFLALAIRPPRGLSLRTMWPCLALMAGWAALGALSLVDLQIHDRLYLAMSTLDHGVRTAFTNAITTTGIPPRNPFFFAGHAAGLRYHYFWLLLCSLVDRLGGAAVGPREAVIAGTLWCGLGLMSLIAVYLRYFDPGGPLNLKRRVFAGMALLGVTGLDILPTSLLWLGYLTGAMTIVPSSVELWNEPVDGWLLTMTWQPHYVASLIACLTGFLILSEAREAATWRRRVVLAMAAGFAFASALGTAIYVTLAFAIFLAVWTCISVVKKWHVETAALVISGITAALLSIPFLRNLSGPGAGGPLVHLTIRSFHPIEIILRGLGTDQWWRVAIADLLFLPLNYLLELGFFFLMGYLALRNFRRRRGNVTRNELAALAMAVTSVLVCTFLRSGVISNNDLGWRGFLIAQFILLLWGANYLAKPAALRERRVLVAAFLVLGAAGAIHDVIMQRSFLLLTDAGLVPGTNWLASSKQVGKRTYANRLAYEWLRRRTPPSARIQQNPGGAFEDVFYLTYANRPTVAAGADCGATFGGDPRACAPIMSRLTNLYSKGEDPARVDPLCRDLGIDILVAKDTDSVWREPQSWVWRLQPVYANDFVRVFACGGEGRAGALTFP